MTSYNIDTLRSIYITNQPYRYPLPWYREAIESSSVTAGSFAPVINTGWHIIPNFLWGHLCSPRQWWEMMIKFEAISVTGLTCRLFNPIPIQTAVSFQGSSTFPAFNNTVYALGYTDDLYETPWFDWRQIAYSGTKPINMFYEFNPAFKEGLIPAKKGGKFSKANDTAQKQEHIFDQEHRFPAHYTTKDTVNNPPSLQMASEKYRRMFLPIYWYHFSYAQYEKTQNVSVAWRDIISQFEEAYMDPSGAFWDPLNRPHELKELRPGKNMIEFTWQAHPTDQGIWFNTDRIAFPTPYPRPRILQVSSGAWNKTSIQREIDPLAPNKTTQKVRHLTEMGLIDPGMTALTASDEMCPEQHSGCPNWREFPIVPTRWFLKELQQSNPWTYNQIEKYYYRGPVDNCPDPSPSTAQGLHMGDAQLIGCQEDIKFPGTEYEMYKYPPTQWFLKAVPLYDDQDNHIPVEMQMFMHITLHVKGKERRSSIYAPTWGPIPQMDLYSVNMDTNFGENFMRGRSGGARRTWMDCADTRPTRSYRTEEIQLYPRDGSSSSSITYPYPAQVQCIAEPSLDTVDPVDRPTRSKFCIKDVTRGVTITTNTVSGARRVHVKRGDKCYK